MRLAAFIRANLKPIVAEWETFALTLTSAAESMSPLALRDHVKGRGRKCPAWIDQFGAWALYYKRNYRCARRNHRCDLRRKRRHYFYGSIASGDDIVRCEHGEHPRMQHLS